MIETKLRTVAVSLFAIVVLCSVSGYGQDAGDGKGARAIEGSWMTTTITSNCQTGQVLQTFPKLISFHMGGTANEASASNAGFLRTASFGEWKYLSDDQFRYELRALRFNADNTYAGPLRVVYNVTYDRLTDTYAAEGISQVILPNGTVAATLCTTETATRVRVSE